MPVPLHWPCRDPWAACRQHFPQLPTDGLTQTLSFLIGLQAPQPRGRTFQEHEEELEEEVTPPANISSSSPDEAIMPLPPMSVDDFKQFQEFFHTIADSLQIPKEV